MNPDLKAKWLADLRTPGLLIGHCCLGRLCIVMGLKSEGSRNVEDVTNEILQVTKLSSFDGTDGYLSEGIMFTAGLTRSQMQTLAHMNDRGRPFCGPPLVAAGWEPDEERLSIADYIEKHL
jgi:hypothetical protein